MKTILVTVEEAGADYKLVSRLRDVGEEIYRAFHFEGIAEVPDMDSAITQLHIHVPSARHLGDVTATIKMALRKHGLSERAQISRVR